MLPVLLQVTQLDEQVTPTATCTKFAPQDKAKTASLSPPPDTVNSDMEDSSPENDLVPVDLPISLVGRAKLTCKVHVFG